MDRFIESVGKIDREIVFQRFEIFQDFSPFDNTTWPYIKETAEWTAQRMPEFEKQIIRQWISKAKVGEELLYFYSLDWVALLR